MLLMGCSNSNNTNNIQGSINFMIPKAIPVNREEGYHTHNIGSYGKNSKFMGFVVANLEKYSENDWQKYKKWYAVLYVFNEDGALKDYKIKYFGTTAEGERHVVEKANAQLSDWLADLPSKKFGNISIQPFKIDFENVKFGLYSAEEIGYYDPKKDPQELKYHIHLLPNDLVFYPPWTGDYDT
jgi:hypothetical protein